MTVAIKVSIAALKALAKHIAASNDIRYYLNTVLIETHKGHCFYVATDGYKMVAHRRVIDQPEEYQAGISVILPKEEIAAFVGIKGVDVATLFVDEQGICQLRQGNRGSIFLSVNAKFPEWRKIIPAKEDLNGNVGYLQPKYLVAAHNALNACERSAVEIFPTIRAKDETSAAVFGGPDTICLIMPARSSEFGIPEWAVPPVEKKPVVRKSAKKPAKTRQPVAA